MDSIQNRPLALLIVDGWGVGSDDAANAIARAHTPYYDEICKTFPQTNLGASGEFIGLAAGVAGNAETGHLNIGTGRVAKTDVLRIADSITEGSFFENEALTSAFAAAKESGGRVHLVGLLSDSEVHSSPESLFALLRMAKKMGVQDAFVHGILDGVDVPQRTADVYVEAVEIKMADIGLGRIASLCGRFFAMDGGENWERTARAFTMLVHGEGDRASDARTAIQSAFLRGVSDEYITPIVIEGTDAVLRDGDTVVFFNHRGDAMRQLVRAVAMPDTGDSKKPKLSVVCMTEYDRSFGLPVAFKSGSESNTFADMLAYSGVHVYRIGETDRFAHLTNSLDGGTYLPRQNEKLVQVETRTDLGRDLAPEMRNFKITDALVRNLEADNTAVFIANFASPGRIAETGNFERTVEAVEYFDTCLGGAIRAINAMNGVAVVTSTHGNCERMSNADGSPDRFATDNAVPFHIIGNAFAGKKLADGGSLKDVAPTVLSLLGLPIPAEMTGSDLVAAR